MIKINLFILMVFLSWTIDAQDTLKTVQLDNIVVTGTKSKIPIEKSGKTIFKITRQDIERSGAQSVATLLNEVPGVQIDGNFGPLGTNISYFIRGALSKSSLILIDGVPFNDPSGVTQTYDLRLLAIEQVESIEILKGGLSTLYGTGAAAGVINISLKKAGEKPFNATASIDYGSFNTFNTYLGFSGNSNKFSYLINGSYKKADGFSAAKDSLETENFDDDGFNSFNFLSKIGYQFTPAFKVNLIGSYDAFDTDFDTGAFTDAETNFSEYKQWRIGISSRYTWKKGYIEGNFFRNTLDRFTDSGFISDYNATNFQGDLILNFALANRLKHIGGINYQKLEYSEGTNDANSFYMIDPYVTLIYDVAQFNVQLGGRLNIHSDYGTNFVYNVNPSYLFEWNVFNLKLYVSYATSFITPSLFQLFGPFGGNPNLKPEESQSVEGGISFYKDKFNLDVAYFYRKDENLILYSAAFEYFNSDEEIKTDGVEVNGHYKLSPTVTFSGHYTYVNRLTDEKIYRIPTHKYGLSVTYLPIDKLTLKLSYLHTGDRNLQYFSNTSFETIAVDASAYGLVNLLGSYQWKNLKLTGSLNNIFNKEYQAIAGFNNIKRNYQIGVKYMF